MKECVLLNSDDGFIVAEVDARSCKYCTSAFTYKDNDGWYHLVDKQTGLSICKTRVLKRLEEVFNDRKSKYEELQKTDAYKIKIERFEKMKLVNNYQKGH